MKQLYDIVEGILDQDFDVQADEKVVATANINKTKAKLGKEFREFIKKQFKVDFELITKKNWEGKTIQKFQAVVSNVQPTWWKNNKAKLKKALDIIGEHTDPKAMGYTDRIRNWEVSFVWEEKFVVYTAGTISYDQYSKSLIFNTSL